MDMKYRVSGHITDGGVRVKGRAIKEAKGTDLAGNVFDISPKCREETYILSIFTKKVKLPQNLELNVTKFVSFSLYSCRDGTYITDHTWD